MCRKKSAKSTSDKFCDFDGVQYLLECSSSSEEIKISISVYLPCFSDLLQYGIMEMIRSKYPESTASTEDGKSSSKYNLTLATTMGSSSPIPPDFICKVSELKRDLLACPFEHAFKFQDENSSDPSASLDLITLSYRPDEKVYIKAYGDRVVVIYSMKFKDTTDSILAKIFIQVYRQSIFVHKTKYKLCASIVVSFLLGICRRQKAAPPSK